MNLSKKNIFIALFSLIIAFFVVFPFVFYTKIIPAMVSNPELITVVEEAVKDNLNADLQIEKPVLKTSLSSIIVFKVDKLSLKKEESNLLEIKNLDVALSFAEIFKKTIILKKIGLDYIYADVNKLMLLAGEPQKQQEQSKFDWKIKWFDALMYVKKCIIVYDMDKDTHIKVDVSNSGISALKEPKFVGFNIIADVEKCGEKVRFTLNSNRTVFIKDRKLFIERGTLGINDSKVYINAVSDEKNNFDVTVYSNNFDVKNVVELLETNLVIPNGKEMISYFKDMKGSFDFNINLTNKTLKGLVKLNKSTLKIIPVNNLPVYLDKGFIDIDEKRITLRDFEGWYGSSKSNTAKLSGTIDDYTKAVDTNIEINGLATNDLMKNYISKLAGCPLTLTGPCGAKMIVKSKYNKMDFSIMGKVPTGQDILVDGASLSPVGYDRAFKADMHFENNILDIDSINYYIAKEINKNTKNIKPILSINGIYDCKNFILKKMGFEIPNPLPSEFLNVLIGQKIFKKGKIAGQLEYLNFGKVPKLKGKLTMQKVRIPSQRLSVKDAVFYTDKDMLHINAFGRFKKSEYKFNGNIKNEMILPVIIKDIHLTVDNIDVDRIMKSMNQQNTAAVGAVPNGQNQKIDTASLASTDSESEDDDAYTFNTGLIIVEKCILEVVQGFYKDIKFGNLIANLTLDKDGILQINSNKFDFAEGTSSLKVHCDLMKHKYSIKLGVKDINSDLIATTLLALPREITGKARGFINLNTDDTLQLNGRIKFDVKDGTIQKVGLVEYALKFAALFRNPLTMISPSTIFDLVNVPEGNFNSINGDLVIKNNVIEKMMIKSSAPQLSSFIIGRYDLVTGDAMLRIYTKFSNKNKGFAGFMRNISLNSLANRVSLGSRNESLYYSAELEQLPPIDADENDCQVFLTKVDGDVQNFNFLSSLKKIK